MGVQKKQPVIVKKVKPYPIATKIFTSETTPPLEGQILRVNTVGFQMNIAQLGFSVGDFYNVEFTLPLSDQTIQTKTRVVRTMDRFVDEKATIKNYLVEMHFINLAPQYAKAISEFTTAILQTAS